MRRATLPPTPPVAPQIVISFAIVPSGSKSENTGCRNTCCLIDTSYLQCVLYTSPKYVLGLRYWQSCSPRVGSAVPYRWSLRASRAYQDFKPRRLEMSVLAITKASDVEGRFGFHGEPVRSHLRPFSCVSNTGISPRGDGHVKAFGGSPCSLFCNSVIGSPCLKRCLYTHCWLSFSQWQRCGDCSRSRCKV